MQRDELITKNMGYVVTLARQYKSDILSTDDLVNEGVIGLVKAAEKYDASRGKPFVTFAAPYIRKSIERREGREEQPGVAGDAVKAPQLLSRWFFTPGAG